MVIFLFFFVAASLAAPKKHKPAPPKSSMFGNWTSVKCTDYGVTDAALPSNIRWSALDAKGAWSEVCNAWNNEPPAKGDVSLPFPEYLMNYFHGPDNWNCQDIKDNACAPGVLQCGDTTAPAGWLVMNSLANLHHVHKEIYEALDTASGQVQAQVGVFGQTFAPVDVNKGIEVLKEILDGAAFVIGVGSAYFWNKIAETVFAQFKNSGDRGFNKDVFNAAVAFVINGNKDALSAASAQLNQQNQLSSAVGTYYSAWQQAQASFVKDIFSGAVGSLSDLGKIVQNGQMNWPASANPDFQDFVGQSQKLLYAQMIPSAWQHGASSHRPIVLESTDPCQSKVGSQLKGYMSDDVAGTTHMCMNGRIYYLVDAVTPIYYDPNCIRFELCEQHTLFQQLPGGDFKTLSGGAWGGVRIDDIVIASHQGWVNNGKKNGWSTPDFASAIQGGASPFDLFADGIQTAGYNNIPFCSVDNLDDITARIQTSGTRGPYWPCE